MINDQIHQLQKKSKALENVHAESVNHQEFKLGVTLRYRDAFEDLGLDFRHQEGIS